jgi:hypothetical protein
MVNYFVYDVQLKTLLAIQNVEITKDRVNALAQFISNSVNVVTIIDILFQQQQNDRKQ